MKLDLLVLQMAVEKTSLYCRSVLSLLQQAWNSDDYQVQLCMVALGWILLNILLILLAWRRHGSSISDMFRRQGSSASKGRLSPVFNKRPTWQDKSHLNGTNFNSSTGLPNGNGLPNGSHLPNGRLRTVSEKSHQS
ncbi:Hypp3250 [Branchiostoma lanceolatum]|uniref:Hypp3250 protein n=1 Tax=Branchiostoma lanceolatum TaxID=7740 RepID=A0A8K0ETL6_BRALA|nr:Hypp3250 [Branchiostoma lanceolatum]